VRRRSRWLVTPVTQDLHRPALPSKNPGCIAEALMFSQTQNDNGTYNTRCLYCFMTIASSIETLEELERVETHHICPEKALADLLSRKPFPPAHAHTR